MLAENNNNNSLYKLENIGFSVDGTDILRELNFAIPRDQITLITGPSGSGKSTLLKLLTALATPSSGKVYYQGEDLCGSNPIELRSKAILSGQKPLIVEGTVRDNMCLPFSLKSNRSKKADNDLFAEYLEKVELPTSFLDKKASKLSGGEAQRMALARALALNPETLILDEPTSALDISHEEKILNYLKSLRGTINLIIVAHSTAYLEIIDRVIIIKNGHLSRDADKMDTTELKQILGEIED